jgi:hypothetical protein
MAAMAAMAAVGTACSMSTSDASSLADGRGGQPSAPSNEGKDPPAPIGNAPGAPTATGVVVVHSAAFPSFRLCFENMLELVPQPDSKVMPQANVVGVEVGSVVRIDPLKAPGKVYVLSERAVRDTPELTCGELLGDGSQALFRNTAYHEANSIDTPLGQDRVQVLALTGCGGQAFVDLVGAKSESCGANWNSTSGNLFVNVIDLPTSAQGATESSIPVQLVNLAPALQTQLGNATLEVTFGELATPGKLPTPVASGTPLLASSQQVTLNVDQTDEQVYGTHGFRIEAREDGGTVKFSVSQSLAAIQDLSSPTDVPTSYYRVASNYALLLTGDPSVPATLDGGAPSPDRRRVQLLAVPVLDPATIDAGTDAAPSTGDGGS